MFAKFAKKFLKLLLNERERERGSKRGREKETLRVNCRNSEQKLFELDFSAARGCVTPIIPLVRQIYFLLNI